MPPGVQEFLAGVTLADVVLWVAAIAAVFASFKWVIPFARKISHFVDDVAGEPARPGIPARLGLMERLSNVEAKQDEQTAALEVVRHEVTTNHGSSLKDAVKHTQSEVASLQKKFDEHLESR